MYTIDLHIGTHWVTLEHFNSYELAKMCLPEHVECQGRILRNTPLYPAQTIVNSYVGHTLDGTYIEVCIVDRRD